MTASGIPKYVRQVPSATADSPKRQLADLLLDGLDAFVADRRDQGRGWRLIARDIWQATNGRVDVTHETLRSWYPDDRGVPDRATA